MSENQLPAVTCEQAVFELGCNPVTVPDGNALILLEIVSASDPDGTADVMVIDESVSSEGCEFTSTIRFRAIDDCGQVSSLETSCTIEVRWSESTSIMSTCPDDLLLSCGNVDNPMLINEWLESVIPGEVCGGEATITNTYQEDGFEQTCSESAGIQLVTFTIEDQCGNSASCTAQIEIKDTGLPILSDRPGDQTVSEDQEIPDIPVITAEDECSSVEVLFSEETTVQNCGYTLERTWTAMDACGNSVSHTQRINISESLVAEINLDSDKTCANGFGAASVTIIDGKEPFAYAWSNGSQTASVDNLEGRCTHCYRH